MLEGRVLRVEARGPPSRVSERRKGTDRLYRTSFTDSMNDSDLSSKQRTSASRHLSFLRMYQVDTTLDLACFNCWIDDSWLLKSMRCAKAGDDSSLKVSV